eukprot:m.67906 g.67906  ORF g.67906 m.67906 type:complete len:237 (+) comp8230_c0_seq8:1615-2325(+)
MLIWTKMNSIFPPNSSLLLLLTTVIIISYNCFGDSGAFQFANFLSSITSLRQQKERDHKMAQRRIRTASTPTTSTQTVPTQMIAFDDTLSMSTNPRPCYHRICGQDGMASSLDEQRPIMYHSRIDSSRVDSEVADEGDEGQEDGAFHASLLHCGGFERLETLKLIGCGIGPLGVCALLDAVARFSTMRSFNVNYNSFSQVVADHTAYLVSHNRTLKHLSIRAAISNIDPIPACINE